MFWLKICFIFVFISCCALAVEEFCKDYPGDVSFGYETSEDKDNYNILYGSKTVYTYRKIHRKKIIRPYSTKVNYPRQVVQQQQIQQQQQFIPLKNMNSNINNINNVDVAQEDKENANETDESPLPIWKLYVPRNAREIRVERVEDGKAVDKFELDKDNFHNKTMTTYTSTYSKAIDVTAQGIVTDGWYAICMSLGISFNKKFSTCQYCTLIKASISSSENKVLKMQEMTSFFTADSIRVKYEVDDLPFPEATVITRIYEDYDKTARCLSIGEVPVTTESSDPIQPDTVVYVDVHGLSTASEYAITTALVAVWKDNPKRVPLTALFYLNPEKKQTVPKCSRLIY